jgi:hypothetical protein
LVGKTAGVSSGTEKKISGRRMAAMGKRNRLQPAKKVQAERIRGIKPKTKVSRTSVKKKKSITA